MNLVYYIINKHYPTFRKDEDVIQSGMLGYAKALKGYSKGLGEFGNYAYACILNEIRAYFKNELKEKYEVYDFIEEVGEGIEDDTEFKLWLMNLRWDLQVVADGKIRGLSTKEISEELGVSTKQVRKIVNELRWLMEKRKGGGE